MTAQRKDSIVLLIHCKDRKGIVARVSGFIHDFGGNILGEAEVSIGDQRAPPRRQALNQGLYEPFGPFDLSAGTQEITIDYSDSALHPGAGGDPSPLGPVKFATNQSLVQTAYIGQLDATGQFKIVSKSPAPIAPEPYDRLAFPGKTCAPA